MISDSGLYASFGLETQIFKFSKIVFHIDGKYQETDKSNWFFKLDFAPIYDFISCKNKPRIEYDKDIVN